MSTDEIILDDLDLTAPATNNVNKPSQEKQPNVLPEQAPSFSVSPAAPKEAKVITKIKTRKSKAAIILSFASIFICVLVIILGIIFITK